MNKKLFCDMQEQLIPGPEALAGLEERLVAQPVRKAARPRWGRYVALAACAALVVAAVPLYGALNPPLHAYALGVEEPAKQELGLMTGDTGGGIDGTHPLTPGGADIVERPVQEEATAAYQALMARFAADYGQGNYPDWYGGSYIDEWGGLIVCVVGAPVEDKSLYLEIEEMCGGHPVGFRDVTYTLAQLNTLQDQVVELLKELDFAEQLWASGVDEENNRVDVTLPFASKKALAGLHKLDPAGDAIAVTVVERQEVNFTATEEPTAYEAAPGVSVQITPTPNELPVPEPMAEEPHYDLLELPQEKQPVELPAPAQTSEAPADVAAAATAPPMVEPAAELPGGAYVGG